MFGQRLSDEQRRGLLRHGKAFFDSLKGEVPTAISAFNEAAQRDPNSKKRLIDWAEESHTDVYGKMELERDWDIAVSNAYACAHWYTSGCNVFNLSEGLVASLVLTDPPNDVKLPFRAVLISLPEGVLSYESVDGHREIRELLVWEEEHSSKTMLTIFELSNNGIRATFPAEDLRDRAIGHRSKVPLEYNHALRLMARVVSNLASWIDHAGESAMEPAPLSWKQLKKLNKRKKEWPKVWLVGKDVTISPEMLDVARVFVKDQTATKPRKEWKLKLAHVVRGHWKMQPHGPGRKLRKRVWVEPYMRGPEGKVAWAHAYQASEG